jgi:hypothetical protein
MTSDQLAVGRAAIAVALKREFVALGYAAKEHLNDYQTIFVVEHPETPGWKAHVAICSGHQKRNRIEVNRTEVTRAKAGYAPKIVTLLNGLRINYERDASSSKVKEATEAQWQERQEKELAGLSDLKGITVQIVRVGPYAGCYEVKLQPGNPMEHLTLPQLVGLHAYLSSL